MITFKEKILFTKQECDLILKKYIDIPINKSEDTDTMKYKSKDIDYNADKWIIDRFINWIENGHLLRFSLLSKIAPHGL